MLFFLFINSNLATGFLLPNFVKSTISAKIKSNSKFTLNYENS